MAKVVRSRADGFYFGIDAGTSSLKALLIDAGGGVAGSASVRYAPGEELAWIETDPEAWWRALCAATRQVLDEARVDAAEVAGVGFAGQMHTLVLLDENQEPVRSAISWSDTRGATERDEIEARVGRAALIAETGSPAVTAFTATRLLWVRRHEPKAWARARTVLLPKDYLRLRLTGEIATDPTDAGATGLLDVRRRAWSARVLAALDLPRSLLPPILPSGAPASVVSATGAREAGLRQGTPVATGAGDQEAAAVGCGIVESGPLLITIGTGGQVFGATTQPIFDLQGRIHTLPHAVPDRWHALAAIPAAGRAIDWWCGIVGADPHAPVRPSSNPPIFVPAIAGERTPSMDETRTGELFGLIDAHTRDDTVFAVREGVAFALRRCVDVLLELGIPADPIVVAGGRSADAELMQTLADVLGRPVATAAHRDGSAYGASLLAAMGAGHALFSKRPLVSAVVSEPSADRAHWHDERYGRFLARAAS